MSKKKKELTRRHISTYRMIIEMKYGKGGEGEREKKNKLWINHELRGKCAYIKKWDNTWNMETLTIYMLSGQIFLIIFLNWMHLHICCLFNFLLPTVCAMTLNYWMRMRMRIWYLHFVWFSTADYHNIVQFFNQLFWFFLTTPTKNNEPKWVENQKIRVIPEEKWWKM